MKNCEIIFNRSLKEYKKKYCHCTQNLLSYSKKEVSDFDKFVELADKNYLLKGRKWWFTKEDQCYHEVPRAIRWTWFRNLNAGIQTLSSLLLVGTLGGAGYGTYYLLTHNKQSETIKPYIDEEFKDIASIVRFEVGEKSTIVTLKADDSTKEIKSVTVKAGKDDLVENTDFTFDVPSQVVTISNESIKAHGNTITIKPTLGDKVVFDGKVKDKNEWDAAIKYAVSNSDDANVFFTYESSSISKDGCIYHKLAKVSNSETGVNKKYHVYNSLGIRNDGLFKISKDLRGSSEMSHYISEVLPGYFETDILPSNLITMLTIFGPESEGIAFDEETKSYNFGDPKYFIKFTKFNDTVVLDSLKIFYQSTTDILFTFKYGEVKSTDIENITINDIDNYKKASMTTEGTLVGANFGKDYTIPTGVNPFFPMITHFKVQDLQRIDYNSSDGVCIKGYDSTTQIRLVNRKQTFLKNENDSYALFIDGEYADITPTVVNPDGITYFKYPANIFKDKTDVVFFNEIGFTNGENVLNSHIELTYPITQ